MRYLNKIIFLNSAHVPYAEVKLDGNVHFIGTQGVGKSTLLRAVCFSIMQTNSDWVYRKKRKILILSIFRLLTHI